MRGLLRVAGGAAAIAGAVRGVRALRETYVPAAARGALGAAAGLAGVAQRVAAEFRAGRAQREAELRADLLAGADLARVRTHVDAWRTGRAERTHDAGAAGEGDHAGSPGRPAGTDQARSGPPAARHRDDDDGRLHPAFAPGAPRPGSAAAAGGGPAAAAPPRAGGSHRAEDRDDGPLGYSFF